MLERIKTPQKQQPLRLTPLFSKTEKNKTPFILDDTVFISSLIKKAEERTKNSLEYKFYKYCADLKKLSFFERLPIVAKDSAKLLFGSLFSIVGCGGDVDNVELDPIFLPQEKPVLDEAFLGTLPLPEKKWTVLVYLAADNNLNTYARLNIEQMKQAGSSADLNIVYLYDNLGTDQTGYYYADAGTSRYLKETGEVNMGQAQTAKNFINYAKTNFPAEKYAFIYWNHGGGVDRSYSAPLLRSVAYDETSSNDALTEIEQEEILHYFSTLIGRKVNLVGYDACLMGTQEIFHLNKNYADIVVASQAEEPGHGWDYRFLNTINSNGNLSSKELATNIVNYFKNFYPTTANVTLSAADLNYANNVSLAINDFCQIAMASGISGAKFYTLFNASTNFSNNANDLKSFMQNIIASSEMTTAVKEQAQVVINTIYTNDGTENDLIFAETHAGNYTSTVGGVSITPSYSTVYKTHLFAEDTDWDEFWEWCSSL